MNLSKGGIVGTPLRGSIPAPTLRGRNWQVILIGSGWQTLELDLYEEVVSRFSSFNPDKVKFITLFFINKHTGEGGGGTFDIAVDFAQLYYYE